MKIAFLILLFTFFIIYVLGKDGFYYFINKRILIKRIDPPVVSLAGDLVLEDSNIIVKFRTAKKIFSLQEIKQINAFSYTDWGLSEYESIDIILDKNYQFKLDASLEEHQTFIQLLLQKLGQEVKLMEWGFLPQENSKDGKNVVFKRIVLKPESL